MTLHTGQSRDAGAVTVLVAALLPALLLVFALVVDGTDQLRVQSRADAIAAEAARAAGTAVNTRGATVDLDPAAARHAAQSYLAARGHSGSILLSPGGTVRATATHSEPAAIGLLSPTVEATGEATVTVGVGTSTGGLS
jgi:Flp pilus assembly protein TadG